MNGLVRPYGAGAVLVEPHDRDTVLSLAIAARDLDGVAEVVPAARTVLLVLTDPSVRDLVVAGVWGLDLEIVDVAGNAADLVLDVRYDGADLAATAAEVGLDPDGLVRAHTDGEYVVAFGGFVPGFGYLTGLDPVLHVARLAQPRTRVPAGSVAIADEFTGIYPAASPGGWRLLGHTEATLWDLDRDPPALLVPGNRVRFRADR